MPIKILLTQKKRNPMVNFSLLVFLKQIFDLNFLKLKWKRKLRTEKKIPTDLKLNIYYDFK